MQTFSFRWGYRLLIGLSICAITATAGLQVNAQGSANDLIKSVTVAASAGVFSTPWDAVPDSLGNTIYFTATSKAGVGVFSVGTNLSDVKTVAVGEPLVAPLGIAISADDKQVYVADPWAAGADGDAIFVIPTAGGTPVAVRGTTGTAPRGVEVIRENGIDQLYFTGLNLADGQPAVLKIAAAGADSPTVIVKGSPLVDPSGITVAKDGSIYIVDRLASGNGLGSVFQVKGSSVKSIADHVRTGSQFAGLALTLDGTTVLVSSLDVKAGTAQVLVINLATLQTSTVNTVIGTNKEAGGIHRALSLNAFAWADSSAGPNGGSVFRVILK